MAHPPIPPDLDPPERLREVLNSYGYDPAVSLMDMLRDPSIEEDLRYRIHCQLLRRVYPEIQKASVTSTSTATKTLSVDWTEIADTIDAATAAGLVDE